MKTNDNKFKEKLDEAVRDMRFKTIIKTNFNFVVKNGKNIETKWKYLGEGVGGRCETFFSKWTKIGKTWRKCAHFDLINIQKYTKIAIFASHSS